jgi:Flp pilus assembly protein CpaB
MFRRSPRSLLLWTGAAVITLVTALVVGTDLSTLHRRARDLGPEMVVAVATRDLPVGTTLEPGDIQGRRVHRSQLPPGVVGPAEIDGQVVTVSVLRDGFVTERNVAAGDRTGLDAVVPPGMRIVRVVVPSPTGDLRVSSSHVDVLATFDAGTGVDPEGEAYGDPTIVVARGALVVATDAGTATDTVAGDAGGAGVALLVTEDEARAVAYASAAAVVTIALVPPEDARAAAPT